MRIEDIKTDIAKMSEDELREFIVENRKAQKRYKDEQASQPKRAKVASITDEKKKQDKQHVYIKHKPRRDLIKKIKKPRKSQKFLVQ